MQSFISIHLSRVFYRDVRTSGECRHRHTQSQRESSVAVLDRPQSQATHDHGQPRERDGRDDANDASVYCNRVFCVSLCVHTVYRVR